MPLVKHHAAVAASAQKTLVTLPARPFESHPSLWMPFPATREYVEFLQDQLARRVRVPSSHPLRYPRSNPFGSLARSIVREGAGRFFHRGGVRVCARAVLASLQGFQGYGVAEKGLLITPACSVRVRLVCPRVVRGSLKHARRVKASAAAAAAAAENNITAAA